MCDALIGTWTLHESDNFEAFLSAIGKVFDLYFLLSELFRLNR